MNKGSSHLLNNLDLRSPVDGSGGGRRRSPVDGSGGGRRRCPVDGSGGGR